MQPSFEYRAKKKVAIENRYQYYILTVQVLYKDKLQIG